MSYTSDTSNPPSRRNSIGANDYNQGGQLENGLRTYTLDRACSAEHLDSVHTTNLRNAPPGKRNCLTF
jgi:hypothetical protein